MKERTSTAFERIFEGYPALLDCREPIARAYELLLGCFRSGKKLLLCGNGGSAADATHIAGELAKAFLLRRAPETAFREALASLPGPDPDALRNLEQALPAVSLAANTALITAVANDTDPELVFAQQVMAYGSAGDVVLGLTTSGASANVVRAFQTGRARGLSSVCLTSLRAPSWLHDLVDVLVAVPAETTPAVQELHLPVYHALCEMIESELFEA